MTSPPALDVTVDGICEWCRRAKATIKTLCLWCWAELHGERRD